MHKYFSKGKMNRNQGVARFPPCWFQCQPLQLDQVKLFSGKLLFFLQSDTRGHRSELHRALPPPRPSWPLPKETNNIKVAQLIAHFFFFPPRITTFQRDAGCGAISGGRICSLLTGTIEKNLLLLRGRCLDTRPLLSERREQ